MEQNTRIYEYKLKLQEAIHAIKASTKNLPDQGNISTSDVLISFLNPKLDKFCKKLNYKRLELKNIFTVRFE